MSLYLLLNLRQSDEEEEKAKKKGEFVRVVRKSQSSGAQQSKKIKSEPSLTGRPKIGRKLRTNLDEDLEFGKVEGKYTFIPSLTTKELIDKIVINGNLKNISVHYENINEND